MQKILVTMMVFVLTIAVQSCAGKASSDGFETTIIEQAVLDSATMLVVDSTERRFDRLTDAHVMLVYHDSLLIASNSVQAYGEPLLSFYEMRGRLHHLADYIPFGSDTDEMVACRIAITGDELFVNDCYYTGRYGTISLRKPLPKADALHLSHSGVEERGVAAVPFRRGLLVENPQRFFDDEAGIHNDVPRLLYYEQGRCLTPQKHVTFQVADVNTGADLHSNTARRRVCFVSHRQPVVEFYDDIPEQSSPTRSLSLRLLRLVTLPSDAPQKIQVGMPKTTMHQKRHHGDRGAGIGATFDQTRRVVGASNQLHAFLCSAADDEHVYLAYCGKQFSYDYHTYPTYILVLDWNGNLVDTYCFDRWIQALSPSAETGVFYLTVYADDDSHSAQMRLVKVVPRSSAPLESTMP